LRPTLSGPLAGSHFGDRFDQDYSRQLLAQGQACIADEANDVAVAGQQLDHAIFTKANFPQTIRKGGGGAELPHSDRDAGLDAIEGAERVRAGTLLSGLAIFRIHAEVTLEWPGGMHSTFLANW